MAVMGRLLVVLVSSAQVDARDADALKAVRTAYTANRGAVSYGIAPFSYTVGKATSLEEAKRGSMHDAHTGDGLYAFDGANARYECLFSPESEVAARVRVNENSYSQPFGSFRVLTDGKVTLWDRVGVALDDKTVLHTSQIDAGTGPFFQYFSIVPFPLQLGNPRPPPLRELDKAIDEILRPNADWKLKSFDDRDQLDGVAVLHIACAVPRPLPDVEFWVDLEHGAVPRRIYLQDEDVGATTDYDDLRQVGRKAWLPFRQTSFIGSNMATQLVIRDADFDKPPPREVFRLEFPEPPSPMVNTAAGQRYEPQKVWDLSRLPSASSPGTITFKMAMPPPAAPTMPGPRKPRPSWPLLVLAVGLVMLAVAAVFWLRQRRRRRDA